MRNQISFNRPPQDIFLNPAKDGGIFLLSPAEYFWRAAPAGLIKGFPASAHAEINHKIASYLEVTRRHKTFSQAVEFNTVPVMLEQAVFRNSLLLARGKCLLSGASATRLLNRYCWENESKDHDPEEQLVTYFRQCQSRNEDAGIPLRGGPLPKNIAIGIECRNTFSYYHFVTESLAQLAQIVDSGVHGDVFFHFPNHPDKTRAFVQGFVAALFPELAGRVFFERVPKDYAHVLTAFDLSCAYYQFPTDVVGAVNVLAPSDVIFRGHDAYRDSQAVLSMNGFHASLPALRRRALRAIEGHDFSHLPKRFFVGRGGGQSSHETAGEAALFEMLQLFNFEYIVFEHLSPLEQIAIMASAELMMSYHGAAFTNMLYAGPNAYVLELGTLQTAVHRWGDYWGFAHVSGCRYINFFADYDQPDQPTNPSLDSDGIVPVALSDQAIAEVMGFVVAVLGKLPSLQSAKPLLTLAARLMEVREYDRALALLEGHSHIVKGNFRLCMAKADCHNARGESGAELSALHLAYTADKPQAKTLLRIFWCAKRSGLPEEMTWALSLLHRDFPKHYGVLLKSNPWIQRLL